MSSDGKENFVLKSNLIDGDYARMRLAGEPEDVNAYLRGMFADGITLTGLADALGISKQVLSAKVKRFGVDVRNPHRQLPHKRCPSCGKRYWNSNNKTCGGARCRVLNTIDVGKLCDAIEIVANYGPWRKVSREIFEQCKDNRSDAIKRRVCKWVDHLGYPDEAKMLASIDNRPQTVDLWVSERQELRELARSLRDTKAAS